MTDKNHHFDPELAKLQADAEVEARFSYCDRTPPSRSSAAKKQDRGQTKHFKSNNTSTEIGRTHMAAYSNSSTALDILNGLDLTDCDTPADQVSHDAINTLLKKYKSDKHNLPHPSFLARQALTVINAAVDHENENRLRRKVIRVVNAGGDETKVKLRNDERIYSYRSLTPPLIAHILLHTKHIINIAPTGQLSNPDFDLLAIYDDNSKSESFGTYLVNETAVNTFARQYNKELSSNEMKEIMFTLRTEAPRRQRDTDRDLIAVGNGIINYRTKKLQPFDPEIIFLSKARVNYNPDAQNPICYNDEDNSSWDLESWMHELTDDAQLTELLWQVVGATIRPHVSWNKSAWFYSEQGNNGKGSLVELMRQIVGSKSYTSIPLTDFSKEFALEPLTQASAILVDENDVGTFIDKAANLKAIITGDVISINRKFRTPISYQFHGFMVQCLNEFPKIKDRSESFYRRQLFVPFNKCFTGAERKYIKDDYLTRTDVLEYALWRVINMEDYYSFSEPEATKIMLSEYKDFNDPIRAFWNELGSEFTWNLLPYTFLYDIYKKWLTDAMPSSSPLGRNTFIKDLSASSGKKPGVVLDEYLSGQTSLADLTDVWVCLGSQTKMRSAGLMNTAEPLVGSFDLVANWGNPASPAGSGNRNIPLAKSHYSGMVRADVWLATHLTDAVINQIEKTRINQPDAVFAADPRTGQIDFDQQATDEKVTVKTGANAPVLTGEKPKFAPTPITPRVQLHVVATEDTDGLTIADPDSDSDTNTDVELETVDTEDGTDTVNQLVTSTTSDDTANQPIATLPFDESLLAPRARARLAKKRGLPEPETGTDSEQDSNNFNSAPNNSTPTTIDKDTTHDDEGV